MLILGLEHRFKPTAEASAVPLQTAWADLRFELHSAQQDNLAMLPGLQRTVPLAVDKRLW